ncbi:MAG: Gfo/Idh/MocA family oxidoreductase [Synergistetes bacterium]|nr:Gfo/Idh/MocA family oxidoreductase [Synergistota bacterium]MCX8128321.1 Gfo/Idh/MocA family oxidoreductase [Synergistota bacterium]MDW8192640.1 Gfo/Idh/MocA family oxidoreductase [Synergistota bacterium]
MEKVKVGIVGAGFIARIHMAAYREIEPFVQIEGICSGRKENAERFAREFGIPRVFNNFEELCASPEIEIVDVCTPTSLHDDVIICAAENKKHVICEKPLTGYFGEDSDKKLIGMEVPKSHMYKKVLEKIEKIERKIKENGVKLMYGENLVYAPSIEKMKKMIKVSSSPILEIRAECSHSGSIASYAKAWRTSGGGSLMRLGSHPVAVVLHLKHFEGLQRNGRPIRAKAVWGEIGNLTKTPEFIKEEKHYVATAWEDVEDWSVLIIDFEDGTKGIVFSNDVSLGGLKNWVQVSLSKGMIYANINPNNMMLAYAPESTIWKDEYIAEKIETKGGWNFPSPDDFWTRGFPQELKDFVLSAKENREPISGFELAKETAKVIYAGYYSSEEGKKIEIL